MRLPAGGAKQRIAFSTTSFVTVSLADSAGGKSIRVVVDSVKGDSATPIPAPVLDSARGAEFRGFVDKSGKPSGLTPYSARRCRRSDSGTAERLFPLGQGRAEGRAIAGPTPRPRPVEREATALPYAE